MDNINILKTEILSNNWYTLKKVTFEGTQKDGSTLTQVREAYDRGNGSVILLYNPKQGTVILTRQFRLPTYINGNEDGMMIECCAGLLDDDNPEECIRRETEEETGYQISVGTKGFRAVYVARLGYRNPLFLRGRVRKRHESERGRRRGKRT
jgi:GDP-mannose pyrophosphatase NudK